MAKSVHSQEEDLKQEHVIHLTRDKNMEVKCNKVSPDYTIKTTGKNFRILSF